MYRPDYDDRDEEQRLQEELEFASRLPPGSHFATAATRALVFPPGVARARDASQMTQGSAAAAAARRNMDAAAFMSMLGGNDADGSASRAHALSSSPYYQRQPAHYPRPYLPAQGAYAALSSPTDAASLYGRRPGYGYALPGGGNVGSPQEQRYHPYSLHAQAAARDLGGFYQRQAQESQAAMLDRAYGAPKRASVENETPNMMSTASAVKPQHQPSALSASYLPKGQSPKSPAPSPASAKSPGGSRGGRGGGRGGRGRGGRGSGGRGGGRGGKAKAEATFKPKLSSKHDAVRKAQKEKEAAAAADAAALIAGRPWFAGSVPLGLPEDKYWLSELQVYLRSNFAEAFGADESDIAAPMHGRNKPIALGQVGIRCIHCRDDPPSERGQQATSYPSLISGIYNSVQQMLRLHFECCLAMPPEVRKKIESLKVSSSARGGRKQYWVDSAKRLGLIDTPHGIHFSRDPYGPIPPLEGPLPGPKAKDAKVGADGKPAEASKGEEVKEDVVNSATTGLPPGGLPPEELYPLVLPEDQALISDYLYLTLEQMQVSISF